MVILVISFPSMVTLSPNCKAFLYQYFLGLFTIHTLGSYKIYKYFTLVFII